MPTLEELLKDKDPDQLRKLLTSVSSSMDDTTSPSVDNAPAPNPTPMAGPVTAPSQELSVPPIGPGGIMPPQQPIPEPKGMGPLADITKYNPSINTGHAFDLPQPAKSPSVSLASTASDSDSEDKESPSNPSSPSIQTEGFTNNTVANLQKVQDEANKEKRLNQAFRSLEMLNAGLMGGRAAALKPNTGYLDQEDKLADEKVGQFSALAEKEKDDPNSQASKQSSAFAQQILVKAGFSPKLVEGMSYNQIEKNFPQITKMMDVKMQTDARRDMAREGALNRAALLESKKSDKKSSDENKELDKTQQMMEQMRGNPAVQQAEKDIYAAHKADSLAKLYSDPNKLNPALVQLLATEVAKIASGGVPTMHELEGLNPQTLNSKMAGYWEKVVNHPSPANAAAFVKQYQDYAHSLTKDARDVIKERYGRILEVKKNKLNDDDYKSLEEKYVNRFAKDEEAETSGKYTQAEENGIARVMKANNVSREKAIKALKDAGRLK